MGKLKIILLKRVRINYSKDKHVPISTTGTISYSGIQGLVFNRYDGAEYYIKFDNILNIELLDDTNKEDM